MGRIAAFVVGGLVGACAALALTPKTGAEMRASVVDQASAVRDNLQDAAASGPQAVYQDVKESAVTFAQEAREQVADRVQDIKGGATNAEDDELRQKIEAARQRIADQVVANVEESRAAVESQEQEDESVVEPIIEAIEDAISEE